MAGVQKQLWRVAALLARRPQQLSSTAPLHALYGVAPSWLGSGVGDAGAGQQRCSLAITAYGPVVGSMPALQARQLLAATSASNGRLMRSHTRLHASMASAALEEDDDDPPMPSYSGRSHSTGRSHAAPHPHGAARPHGAADHPQSAERLSAAEYRALHHMKVDDLEAPEPFQAFSDAPFPRPVLEQFKREGFVSPTPIQAQAWPIALQGRDLIAIASTGSGKTAGFLLPAFKMILEQQQQQQQKQQEGDRPARGGRGWGRQDRYDRYDPRDARGPYALVLAPTRELAQQIEAECAKFGRPLGIKSACLYGGASRGPQGGALRRSPHIVIATPGRLLDFVEGREVDLSGVKTLVLDEADRMLDMGFEPQIQDVVSHLRGGQGAADDTASSGSSSSGSGGGHQTLFFSATWPREVKAIARQFCQNDPVHVFMGNVASKLVANRDIVQKVRILASDRDKLDALTEYLQGLEPGARVMVFCSTKRVCDWLSMTLNHETDIRCAAVHGDKTQAAREFALRCFKEGRTKVLVATDVAARGLDIKGVAAVVNYDFPDEAEMYVHRIGRTGRAGASGESLALITRNDAAAARQLVAIMTEAQQEVPSELLDMAEQHRGGSRSRFGSRGGGRRDRWGGGGGGYGRRGGGGSGGSRGHHDDWHGSGRRESAWGGSRDEWGGRGGWGDRGRTRAGHSSSW